MNNKTNKDIMKLSFKLLDIERRLKVIENRLSKHLYTIGLHKDEV